MYGIPRAELYAQVDAFAREKGMEDIAPLFRKGAVLAQNPRDFESLSELDEADKAIIRRETTRKSPSRCIVFTRIDKYLCTFRQVAPAS